MKATGASHKRTVAAWTLPVLLCAGVLVGMATGVFFTNSQHASNGRGFGQYGVSSYAGTHNFPTPPTITVDQMNPSDIGAGNQCQSTACTGNAGSGGFYCLIVNATMTVGTGSCKATDWAVDVNMSTTGGWNAGVDKLTVYVTASGTGSAIVSPITDTLTFTAASGTVYMNFYLDFGQYPVFPDNASINTLQVVVSGT